MLFKPGENVRFTRTEDDKVEIVIGDKVTVWDPEGSHREDAANEAAEMLKEIDGNS